MPSVDPSPKKISIVIPVYNSEKSLEILLFRLDQALQEMRRDFEIVLVDDASSDNSWSVLKQLKKNYGQTVRISRLLINSGQHNAILCGLYLAKGEIIVTMDDDLQNPPEEISKLVSVIDEGFDLAIASYDSKKHSAVRNVGGRLVDWILRRIFGLPSTFQLTSFRAAKQIVVKNVITMGGVYPYITAMMFSNASNYRNVLVRHEPRAFGHSNYSMKRSLMLATNLIFSYSPYPLYFVGGLAFIAFVLSMVFGIVTLFRALIDDISVPGWASTIVIVSFFSAFTLLCLVIYGVYLSRISQQLTRTRLPYTISEMFD